MKIKECYFCHANININQGLADIGGLKICQTCYETRKARTEIPCEICGEFVKITSNVLTTSALCNNCELKANLPKAYISARLNEPCDKCGDIALPHHATVYGQNICHTCYKDQPTCTQLYSGDKGYSAFPSRPSLSACLLPKDSSCKSCCIVCKTSLADPASLIERWGIPTICSDCDGPKWWEYMKNNYELLKKENGNG